MAANRRGSPPHSVRLKRRRRAAWAGADAGPLLAVGEALVAIHGWTFMLGPGFVVGIGNGLILGYLMYKSGLVPRGMAMLGVVGGPLIILHGTAVTFGVVEPGSVWQGVASIPISMGVVSWHLASRQGIQFSGRGCASCQPC